MENHKAPPEIYRSQHGMTESPAAQHIVMLRPDILNRDSDLNFIQIAKAFQDFGHRVTIITCTSTLVDIHKHLKNIYIIKTSTWIPFTIYGKLEYPLYLLRTLATTLKYLLIHILPEPNVIFCNTSCLALPILALDKSRTVIHMQNPWEFLQMCRNNHFWNWLLRKSTSFAKEVIVSDNNTKRIYKEQLCKKSCSTLYPCIGMDEYPKEVDDFEVKEMIPNFPENGVLFCSFGEYYVQSNFELALAGFSLAINMVEQKNTRKMHLILGGNYDPTDHQQKEYFSKIKRLVYVKMYTENITLLQNVSQSQRKYLMSKARGIIHPTLDDQFSVCIFEAMCLAKTVIATDCSFGKEVLINQVTGYLVPPNPMDFAEVIEKLTNNKILSVYIGNLAETEYRYKYSFAQFSQCINRIVSKHTSKYCS